MKPTQFILLALLWGAMVATPAAAHSDTASVVRTTYRAGSLDYRFYHKFTLQAGNLPYIAGSNATMTLPVGSLLKKWNSPGAYNSATATAMAPALFFFSDWTCPACRAMHQRLTERATADPTFFAFVVPGYQNAEGRAIQRMLLVVREVDETTYHRATEALMAGTLPPTEAAVKQYLQANASAQANYLLTLDPNQKATRPTTQPTPEEMQALRNQSMVSMVELTLNLAGSILQENTDRTGATGMPRSIVGTETVNGYPEDLGVLDAAIKRANTQQEKEAKTLTQTLKPNKSVFSTPQTTVNMPPVKSGEKSVVSIPYTNTGTEPLYVSGIGISCGCTKVKDAEKQRIVQPGKSDVIEVTIDTQGLVVTPQYKEIYVTSSASNATAFGMIPISLYLTFKP